MKKDLEVSWNAASELPLTSSLLLFLAKRFATLTGPGLKERHSSEGNLRPESRVREFQEN